ncbi:MAG TPA: branched-chain amino acid transaminase [Sphingobacteriaceae bacterium]
MGYFNEKTILYLNGQFLPAVNTTTDLYGQTIHYGYGVFEGIRAYQTHNGTRIFKACEHYERLRRSCELMNIPYKWDDQELINETYKLLELNNLKDAYIRPLIFCEPNMSLTQPRDASIMICAWEWGAYLGDKLLRLCISSFQRPNPRSIKVEAKATGHYVNSILAASEAKERGFDEALLMDMHNQVAEAPGANFFLEKNGVLYTPPKGNILPGITRATVIELCAGLEIPVYEKPLTIEDIQEADSAFLCGTAAEIIGVGSIDDTSFSVAWSDSLGATIQRAYKNLVMEKESYEIII